MEQLEVKHRNERGALSKVQEKELEQVKQVYEKDMDKLRQSQKTDLDKRVQIFFLNYKYMYVLKYNTCECIIQKIL